MNALARLRSFLAALIRRPRMEREMERELEFHVDSRADDLVAAGMSRADALRAAREEFGDPLRWKEQAREIRGVAFLDTLRANVVYGLRWLRRSPAFAAAAILSLGLGIGANAAIFSLIDAVLLRSLPVHRPEELAIFSTSTPGGDPSYGFSYNFYRAFREERRSLVDIAAFSRLRINADVDGSSSNAAGLLVSGNYYGLLGVPPFLGRIIVPEDDAQPGAGNVAVLSYGYWQRQFGADPAIVGKSIRLNGYTFTVVGVSAPEFFGTNIGDAVDIAVPMAMQLQVTADAVDSLLTGQGADEFWLTLIGRLRRGASLTGAATELDGIFQRLLPDLLAKMGPKARMFGHPHVMLEPGSRGLSELRRRFSRPLWVLMGVVALVLLISCANVANLLLARAASRRHEIAIRVSLGATRLRLARQLLTESLLLSMFGGALGLALTVWTSRAVSAQLVDTGRSAIAAPTDVRVLAFTFGVSLLTGLLFGLVPAIGASRLTAHDALRSGARSTAAGGRFGVRGWLIAGQVSVSVVLLIGAGLFVRTLINLRSIDLGFEREQVLALRLQPHGSNQKRPNEARLRQQYLALLDRVRAIPGVVSVSMSGTTPLGNESLVGAPVTVPGYEPRQAAQPGERTRFMQVFPEYFATLGIPLVAGRDLRPSDDDARAPKVALINQTMAARFFANASDAIGHRFEIPLVRQSFEIIGVVRDVRDGALRETVAPLAYMTYAHTPTGRGQMTLLVRCAASPSGIAPAIRQLAREMDPAMPLPDVETLSTRVDAAMRQERLVASLSTIFGGLALVLATVGLYGVLAYAVARRQTEFGVRLALGASPARLRRVVLAESLTLVVVGIAIGVAAAVAIVRLIERMLFGLAPLDAVSFGGACATLLVIAAAAAYYPARRASRVDPVVVLRAE